MDRSKIVVGSVLTLCSFSARLPAQGPTVAGIVTNAAGERVEHADVSSFWRANGSPQRPDGQEYNLEDPEEVDRFWGNVGQMEPLRTGTTSGADGAFTLDTKGRRNFIVMDSERELGAVFRFQGEKSRVGEIIEFSPITTVKATVRVKNSESVPAWSHAYVHLEPDPAYPLANTRIASCGTFAQNLELRLPKGTFRLEVYAMSSRTQPENIDLRVFPDAEFIVDGQGGTIDLGILELEEDLPDLADLERESKEVGSWRDFTEHYGEPSPSWHAVDARGIDHQSRIEDLRGKWVLIEFWGLSCVPCIAKHIPELRDFYNRNNYRRDKFEVVGVCIDFTGKLNTIKDLDSKLEPIVEKVWKGKEIPFPVVLDNTFKSWERFGIPGLGTAVLVDPQGNIAEGGLDELEAALRTEVPSGK